MLMRRAEDPAGQAAGDEVVVPVQGADDVTLGRRHMQPRFNELFRISRHRLAMRTPNGCKYKFKVSTGGVPVRAHAGVG